MEELPPPFVRVDGLANLRDICGWPVESPGDLTRKLQVRKGVLYRGPDPRPITPKGVEKLRELGVRTVFDIRSKPQIEKAGGATELEGIKRLWCPIFSEGDYSPARAAERYKLYASDGTDGIVEAFTEILQSGAPQFRIILLHLLKTEPGEATLMHCTTGNNRSGVFIGILLSLLGVSPSLVAEEYSLSTIGLAPTRDEVVKRLMQSPVFKNAGGGGKERAERMVGARRESMIAMLEMVDRIWGGVEGYVRGLCGLSEEEVEGLRGRLVGEVEAAADAHYL